MTPMPGLPRLFVTDLDGTLLRNDASLSDFSRRALIRLLEEGVNFSIASARSVTSIKMLLGDLPLRLPVVERNGSCISDYVSGKHLIVNAVDPEIVRGVHELSMHSGREPHLTVYEEEQDRVLYSRIDNEGLEWFLGERRQAGDARFVRVDDLSAHLESRVVSVCLIDRCEPLARLMQEIMEAWPERLEYHFFENPYHRGWWWLTIHDRKATKAQGLRTMLRRFGWTPAQLTVFGDERNDIPMFRDAAHAVAVGNALPEVKSHAHEVIGANEEDSVARYLLEVCGVHIDP